MSAIQEIFKKYVPEYLDLYGDRMPKVHKKVIHAIRECRSGTFGTALYACEECGATHTLQCSCKNRHCPTCQHEKAAQWLQTQTQKLLPCNYFLITLTLPEGLRQVVRSHQRSAYAALFLCASGALTKLAGDKRFVGTSRIGFLAALHTWGGQLQYHPHLHIIVPAGGLTQDGCGWLSSRQDLFVHTKPLARIFRAKFHDAMKAAGLVEKIDPSVWKTEWVVDSEAVGNGQTTFRYLARYVFRVAISNNRIISYDNHIVTFRYKDSDTGKWREMSLDAMEFIRRFLQHVLPTGFMKIRHYGFLNSNCRAALQNICEMISTLYDGIRKVVLPLSKPKRIFLKCRRCGHILRQVYFLLPFGKVMSG